MIQFPHNFLWGAATSAHQVEGNNIDSDWWEWEKRLGLKEASGDASSHYQLYQEDFDLAKSLNHNAHRLSIEWSRIEPQEGEFSEQELKHYRDVILALKERGLEPVITLHHFTNPLWFAKIGGWKNKKAAQYFCRYVEKVVSFLNDEVYFWVTINEPLVFIYQSYILGTWPPQEKSLIKAKTVMHNLAIAHIKAYRLIHSIYKIKKLSSPKVSIAQNLQAFIICTATLRNKFSAYLRAKYYNFEFIERLLRHHSLDFIGINYYGPLLVETYGWGAKNLFLDVSRKAHGEFKKNSLGWYIYPEGLYKLMIRLKRYNLPVFVLENGICTADDNLRWEYISQHLMNMHRAIQNGVKVLGYIYWSLIDNFEWDKGFAPRFGLIDVDYHNYKRTIRESARKFAEVCKTGALAKDGINK
jgi:beta-glucosidase